MCQNVTEVQLTEVDVKLSNLTAVQHLLVQFVDADVKLSNLTAVQHLLVQFVDVDVKLLKPSKQLVLFCPHGQLLGQLGDTQECAPAPRLLGLEDVAEDVVTHVEHLVAVRPHDVREHIHGAPGVDVLGGDGSCVGANPQLSSFLAITTFCYLTMNTQSTTKVISALQFPGHHHILLLNTEHPVNHEGHISSPVPWPSPHSVT